MFSFLHHYYHVVTHYYIGYYCILLQNHYYVLIHHYNIIMISLLHYYDIIMTSLWHHYDIIITITIITLCYIIITHYYISYYSVRVCIIAISILHIITLLLLCHWDWLLHHYYIIITNGKSCYNDLDSVIMSYAKRQSPLLPCYYTVTSLHHYYNGFYYYPLLHISVSQTFRLQFSCFLESMWLQSFSEFDNQSSFYCNTCESCDDSKHGKQI